MLHRWHLALGIAALAAASVIRSPILHAQSPAGFRFDSLALLDDMHHFIETGFPIGANESSRIGHSER
jgi:hypothetical protein